MVISRIAKELPRPEDVIRTEGFLHGKSHQPSGETRRRLAVTQ